MPSQKFFYLGFELSNAFLEKLNSCKPSEKTFLTDNKYLEIVDIEGRSFIGRRFENAISPRQADDTARNVLSLIKRIVPDWTLSASDATLFAVEEKPTYSDAG
jgi:hypothetical protein